MSGKTHSNLFAFALAYVKVIEQIERTADAEQLHRLEEERVMRHNEFADALKAAGIHYKDRDHVTRIAFRIAKEEL